MNYKACTKCKEELPAITEYFYTAKASSDGLSSWCKKCKNEADKERYRKRRENQSTEYKKWTVVDDRYLEKRLEELPNSYTLVEKMNIIGKEMDRTPCAIKNRIYNKRIRQNDTERQRGISSRHKDKYKVGQAIRIRRRLRGDTADTINGRIVAVYDNFVLVNTGQYKEAFTYVDMIIGDVEVRK